MKRLFIIFIFVLLGSFFYYPVSAMTVFSPIIELEASPGESVRGIVKLYNETSENLALTSSIEAFTAGDEPGQPIYLPPEAKYDFLSWFSLDESAIALTARQVGLVPFTIKVPFDAVPGGYYGVIFWQNNPEQNNNEAVSINSRVGTLVFLKVKGEVEERGEISEFSIKDQQNTFFEMPINFQVKFSNQGNIHLSPNGTIKLQNLIGQTHYLAVNSEKRNVLPQNTRLFEIIWGNPSSNGNFISDFLSRLGQEFNYLTIGPYTATLELNYGKDNPQVVNQEVRFWFWPWRLIVATLIVLIILTFLIRLNSKINSLKKKVVRKKNDQQ